MNGFEQPSDDGEAPDAGEVAELRRRAAATPPEPDLELIRQSLRGLRYGAVTIVVQDGVIVQIDRTDKRRVRRDLPRPAVRPPRGG